MREARDVGAGDDADHAGRGERVGGLDRDDARVGELGAHDRGVARRGQRIEIADEPALAAQQRLVLDALQRAPDETPSDGFGWRHGPSLQSG